MSDTINIVCPMLENRDEERFEILFRSLMKFVFNKNFVIHLVNQSGKSPIKSKRILTYKESDLHECLSDQKFHFFGWWRQQIIKLLSHKMSPSNEVLLLDCDCFLTKPLSKKNFYYNRKIKLSLMKDGSFDNWYNGSKEVLGFRNTETPILRIGVIPIIFSTAILRAIDSYLNCLYGPNWVRVLLDIISKNHHYKISDAWTETTLYHIYAKESGLLNKYHHIISNNIMYGNSIWNESQADSWIAEKSFDKKHEFYFTVAQSATKKPADWVYSKIKEYIC